MTIVKKHLRKSKHQKSIVKTHRRRIRRRMALNCISCGKNIPPPQPRGVLYCSDKCAHKAGEKDWEETPEGMNWLGQERLSSNKDSKFDS